MACHHAELGRINTEGRFSQFSLATFLVALAPIVAARSPASLALFVVDTIAGAVGRVFLGSLSTANRRARPEDPVF
jgi:hypothetical protein